MSVELIGGLIVFLIGLIGGGVGWHQIRRHGEEREKRRQAEDKTDAYRAANDALRGADPSLDELARVSAREASREP